MSYSGAKIHQKKVSPFKKSSSQIPHIAVQYPRDALDTILEQNRRYQREQLLATVACLEKERAALVGLAKLESDIKTWHHRILDERAADWPRCQGGGGGGDLVDMTTLLRQIYDDTWRRELDAFLKLVPNGGCWCHTTGADYGGAQLSNNNFCPPFFGAAATHRGAASKK